MPTSKAHNPDYSDCQFRTLLTNLPAGVQHMLDRALDSLGTDLNVMPRWKEPVATPDGPVLERQFFPHASNDICCADGTGFILYQSGVVDLGHDKDLFKSRIKGAIHWAHYYWPHEGNQDICSIQEEIPNTKDPKEIDTKDWLPGDYFLYFDKGRDDRAAHINVYLGPFVEVVDGQVVEGAVYEIFNSSLGTTGRNAYCIPGSLAGHIRYCKSVGRRIFRCRTKAIERLFRNLVAAPVEFADDAGRAGKPSPAEIAWKLSVSAEAPYPVGRNLTWHDGIHLVFGDGLKSQAVESFAPGEVVLARFGKTPSADHSSLVLLRHRLVTSQMRLLPPPPDDPSREDPDAGSAEPFYSLCMQLAPISLYLADGTECAPGIPELYGMSSREIPEGKAAAPPWLQRIWLRPRPELIKIIPDTAQVTLMALTQTESDPKPTLRPIATPKGLTARRWHALSELESITVDGTRYWLLPVDGADTNAAVWDQKIPAPTIPRGKKLSYYNPQTKNTIDCGKWLPGTTVLAHADSDGKATLIRVTGEDGTPVSGEHGMLVRILDHQQPGLAMSAYVDSPDENKDQYDYDEQSGVLTFKENVRRITLYTETAGEGEQRYFLDSSAVDITRLTTDREFRIRERAETGPRTKSPRAWPDLTAGVWMSDDEIARIEQEMAAKDTALLEGIAARLEKQQSILAGVKTKASGWAIENDALVAASELPASGTLTIYRKISGNKWHRRFDEPHAGDDAAQQEQELTVEIDPPQGVGIFPLLKPAGREQSAVFELVFAATEEGTNQAEIDRVDNDNKAREPLVKKLLNEEIADLRTESRLAAADRNVAREPIGHMGDVAAPVAEPADKSVKGVHFEIFAGKNLVDPSVAGSDGAIVPVGKSPWAVWKDSAADGFFSRDFVNRLVDLLKKESQQHRIDLGDLDAAFGDDNVVQPEEWIAFCARNQRALSRLITVHKPEWTIDWSAEVKTSKTRGIHTPGDDRRKLTDDSRKLNWGSGITLEGISGDAFFYHPLRFIEWLNTGLDFAVSGLAKDQQPRVKIKRLEGGDEIELPADARDPGLFRYRAFVGEGAKDQAPVRVTLENVNTATPTFTAILNRGIARTIRLIEPRVRREFQSVQPSLDTEYLAPVSQSDVSGRGGFLLADGNACLQESGYSRTSILFTVEYNVRIPGTVSLVLSGDAGFKIADVDVTGAKCAKPPAGNSVSLPLTDDAVAGATVEESVVRGARAFTIAVTVIASTRKTDAAAKLTATFSGGDLPSQRKLEVPIETRTLVYTRSNPPRGEDVAKLQLYLSQIFAADDLPCYRYVARQGDYSGKELKRVYVDGAYGASVARALWRFIYTFGRLSDFAAWPIRVTDAKGADAASATSAQITGVPHALLEGAPPDKPIDPAGCPADLYARRMGAVKETYAHYPVVNSALIAEIVKRFKPPFVLPHLEIFFEKTEFLVSLNNTEIRDDWNKDGAIGKSTILAMPGDSFVAEIRWLDADESRDGDMTVVLQLPEASAYRFDGFAPTTRLELKLRSLLASGKLKLVSAGAVSSSPADNMLSIATAEGRKLGERQLHGSRDLLQRQSGDSCRDAACAQYWLSVIPDKDPKTPDASIYGNTIAQGRGKDRRQVMLIDGKWNDKCVQSLERFRDQYAQVCSELGTLLKAVRDEASKHAAGVP